MIQPADLQLHGPFPGHDLPGEEAEALLWVLWPDKERRREPGLFQTKWWDYRTLSPAHATYLFHDILVVETRRIIREHIDPTPPTVGVNGVLRDWHPIKAGDVFDPPAATSRIAYWKRKVHGLIRARQAADADGIPYELFIRTALRHFYFGGGTYVMQREDQAGKRTLMPEPNLLYGEECLAQIREAWLEQVQMRVHGARHPRYLAANDDGHPDHQAHRDWLASQIAHRAVQDRVTARLVREGWLTVRQAVRMVRDPQLLARTLRASP